MTSQPIGNKRQIVSKILISVVIITTLSAQAYTAFLRMACNSVFIPLFCSLPTDPSLYPFLDYPMYSAIKKEGVTVPLYRLVAIFDDGTEKQLHPEDFGLSLYWFNTRLLPAFQAEQALKIKSYVLAYEKAGNRPFVAIRFENNRVKITKEGIMSGVPDAITTNFPMTATEE